MRWAPSDTLSDADVERGLQGVLRDGLATQAMLTLTGGVFLVAYALELGASNAAVGLLAGLPTLTQLVQLPAVALVERVRERRSICVLATAASRLFWIPIVLTPLAPPAWRLPILVASLVGYTALSAVSVTSWNSWMRDLIPMDRLGAFIAKRMALATGLSVGLNLAAGAFVDGWKATRPGQGLWAYSVLFLVGFLAGMLGVVTIARIPEPRMAEPTRPVHPLGRLGAPLKDRNFRNLLAFLGPWNFAVNLAAPFFTVYMLRRLSFPLSQVVALSVVSQLVHTASLHLWGRFTDRYSNKSVLGVCGPLLLACILGWTFTTLPEPHRFTLPLVVILHVASGIATAGVLLASRHITLKLAPREEATAYLATSGVVNALAAGLAPIVGGRFADFFLKRELALTLTWRSPSHSLSIPTLNFQQWDFFFCLAFVLGLYSLHRLALVREVGEAGERTVVHEVWVEVRKGVRNLSSIAGLRPLMQVPLVVVKVPVRVGQASMRRMGWGRTGRRKLQKSRG
jgi:MFS family permease